VSISTRYLHYAHILQVLDQQGNGLIWIALDILGHMLSVTMTELSTSTGAPTIKLAMYGHSSSVTISACYLAYLHSFEGLY
jgi:hypothetical protein